MKVIIIGAGFAGLSAFYTLLKNGQDVLIFDKRSHFEYVPSLHECIGDDARIESICLDLRHILGRRFINERVDKIEQGRVNGHPYDHLIIATGAVTNTFKKMSFEKHAYGFKSVDDIRKINKRLEHAKRVVVIGGGYTGVEIAMMLPGKVTLVHAGRTLLDTLNPKAQKTALLALKRKGVDVVLGKSVLECRKDRVVLDDRMIESDLTILSAGVRPNLIDSKDALYAGDVAGIGTAHDAILQGKKAGYEVLSRDHKITKLGVFAVALGRDDGMIVGRNFCMRSRFIGLVKRLIEKKVLFGFKTGFV